MVATMARWSIQRSQRRRAGGPAWPAALAIVALLAHVLVPLAQAAPGLRGADGRVLPLVLCRTAADPAGVPGPRPLDHAKPCVLCQALDPTGIAPSPAGPALPAVAVRTGPRPWLVPIVPDAGSPRLRPPARAPPAVLQV